MGVRLVFLFLNQRVIFIIFSCEIQKSLHIITDIFAFFPYHADFYADRWIERDAGNIGRGKFIGHAGIEKTSAVVIFQKLQSGINLTVVHQNMRCKTFQFKPDFQELVLDGVSVEENQGYLCHILNRGFFFSD